MNFTLPSELTLENAAATLAEARSALKQGSNTIDLAPLQKVDSSAIAVMLGLQRHALQHDLTLEFRNTPANLQSLMALYGIEDLLFTRH